MIMQVLADEGVTAIFGYSGGAILPTYDAVFLYNEQAREAAQPQIPLIVPANEQGAGFMAAGYARASGQVGVCLVTSGPGATNTVTPVRDCMADSIPIVVICWPSARAPPSVPTPSRKPPCPRSWARSPSTSSSSPIPRSSRSPCAPPSRSPAPGARDRWWWTSRRTCRTGKGVFRGEGLLPIPGYRRRMRELAAVDPRESRRRRASSPCSASPQRPLIYAGGGVINGNAAARRSPSSPRPSASRW